MGGSFSTALAGDFAGSTILGFESLASAGGFGRWSWVIVLGGIDTVVETVSMTVTFSGTGRLAAGAVSEEIGDAGTFAGKTATLVAGQR